MKSAGKARNNGLYRHIRTSKEIIRNLLNDSFNYKPVMCHSCKILRQTFFQVTYLNQSSQIINFQVT